MLVLGICMGLVALLFIEMMKYMHQLFHKIPLPAPWLPFIGGFVLILLAMLVSNQYLGLSTDLLNLTLSGVQGGCAGLYGKSSLHPSHWGLVIVVGLLHQCL